MDEEPVIQQVHDWPDWLQVRRMELIKVNPKSPAWLDLIEKVSTLDMVLGHPLDRVRLHLIHMLIV